MAWTEVLIHSRHDAVLNRVAEKALAGERLSWDEALALMECQDLLFLGHLADEVRRRRSGNEYVYFINNAHINYTNVCQNFCAFCAFAKHPGDEEAYTLTLDEIESKARQAAAQGVSEIHIVGGINPSLPFSYYEEMLARVRSAAPQAHIQAFTAVEVDHLARISGLGLEGVLKRLGELGLGSLPGGGAEVFSPRVRKLLCPRKIPAERWLEVMEVAHGLGFKSNATMLYGHIETAAERVEHLLRLRELQDRTGGFMAFIPLAFHPANTRLAHLSPPTAYDDLRMLAVSRLVLDNFPHIKAFWVMITPRLAQIAVYFGADDLDGTVREEKITHAAGATTPQYLPFNELVTMIRRTGRIPVERDTCYRVLRVFGDPGAPGHPEDAGPAT